MKWPKIKEAIRSDLLARNLKAPQLRLRALDNVGKLLCEKYPSFGDNCAVVSDVGLHGVSHELARKKRNGKLNGAEKSVLNQIFALVSGSLPPSGERSVRSIPRRAREAKATLKAKEINAAFKPGLPFVAHSTSKVLILGTLPGDEAIRLQRYYANANNQFWGILSHVYGEKIPVDAERLEFLRRHGLALWDVLQSADRVGSLDSALRNQTPNDFESLFRTHPDLKVIVFNGEGARKTFVRHVKMGNISVFSKFLQQVCLPSTSPTPGKNVLSVEDKLIRWAQLKTL
jgi:hypoxanthine-DNA glycosylase